MAISFDTINFQNTGDVATDAEASLSQLDLSKIDAANANLKASDTSGSGFADYGFTEEFEFFDASTNVTRRMVDLVSDSTNYVRAEASVINFDETSTYSGLFSDSDVVSRIKNNNSFLERVIASRNGFDEVFTTDELYNSAVESSARESIFFSSSRIVDRGWTVDSTRLFDKLNVRFNAGSVDSGFRNDSIYLEL